MLTCFFFFVLFNSCFIIYHSFKNSEKPGIHRFETFQFNVCFIHTSVLKYNEVPLQDVFIDNPTCICV